MHVCFMCRCNLGLWRGDGEGAGEGRGAAAGDTGEGRGERRRGEGGEDTERKPRRDGDGPELPGLRPELLLPVRRPSPPSQHSHVSTCMMHACS